MARAEVERDTARHEASMACMDADVARSARAKTPSWLGSKMPWQFQRRLGGRRKTRLAILSSSESSASRARD